MDKLSTKDVNVLASLVQVAHYIGWKNTFMVLIRHGFLQINTCQLEAIKWL